MARERLTNVSTIGLGALYIALGIAETIRLFVTDSGGFAFWFGTLVGGGTLILLGILVYRERPRVYAGLVIGGCFAGMLATMWTLLIPVIAVAVIVLTLQRTSAAEPPGH